MPDSVEIPAPVNTTPRRAAKQQGEFGEIAIERFT